ncbi:type I-E CRISPR-associated protein Cas6/Cse3/CasE [Castellaniella sp.]|uniref:type I-E CRISPR-associated protein Cas6/Cse3/CasE n=1 Tax=Castellaniella sp. TaxID=1955812 RepID=UPI002AFDCDAA|nr:type I-E CRISPR-associated protein Cas6/Cse3/CasE [Castellaniella sp.]
MTSISPLFLLHTQPDARLLAAWVARHHARHARQSADLGDAFHGLFRAAFGSFAPQPFRYLDERRGLLAYTRLDLRAMAEQVALADPQAAQTLGLGASAEHGGYRLRPFPSEWAVGQELGFEVRVRPTVRGPQGEQDVFLRAVARVGGAEGESVERRAIYAQWLFEHLSEREGVMHQPWQGAVELLDVQLNAFTRSKVVRRTQASEGQDRKGKVVDGPDATLVGRLRVINSVAFAHLLARGIGRHRAFGFGMLLLHRVN